MNKINVIAAPGPVVYPLLAANDERINISFGKEGDADAVFDSTVSLVRRGLRIDKVLVKGLMQIVPSIGNKTAVWRKGSAADVLLRAYLSRSGKKVEIVYVNDQSEIMKLLKSGEVDSAVVSSAFGKGIRFEDLIPEMPGSCGVHINRNEEVILEAYQKGIEAFKRNPDEASNVVISKLPMKMDPSFVKGTMLNSILGIEHVNDYFGFKNAIAPFLKE
ncbi:DUF3834 domain-containing protein [Sulfuracidifex metallicus]|jgi:hypothetical protein|uniref:DUF3834 domain-containing protein n=2 Tax=Sulfuracidifex metallicus TaxID=47303 RepID=UPI0012DC2C5C|nr:DUF3834 domain-containing protein [Sulfuracidifex metallicus]WOE50077.1 DUF3834 domain-containing protein [Sulfuracidifex metallicus DSM 6482 = JCM 9184]